MKFLNNKGFSLLEILVALGLTSVLSLIIMELMAQSTKNNLTSEVKNDALQLTSKMEEALKNKELCRLSLKQHDFSDSKIDLVNWNQNKDEYQKIFQVGQQIGKVKILEISIEDESKFIPTADGGYTNLIVNVDLSNSNQRKINGGSTKMLKIKTFVDNCARSLIINQLSKENLKLECQNSQGVLKNAVSGSVSVGWYGVCQYCREPRESIYDCEQPGV
jgi:prepilin-type N-terminal cleavage/methylation domain-containing protein